MSLWVYWLKRYKLSKNNQQAIYLNKLKKKKFISHSHRIHGSLGSVETMGGLKDLGLFSNGFITPQSTKEKNLKGISFLSIFNFF